MSAVRERTTYGQTLHERIDLEVTRCTCGVLFAMPAAMLKARRNNGANFYCPNGHQLSFHETKADRLQAKLENAEHQRDVARRQRDMAEQEAKENERRRAAQKGATTRAKKRHAAGVCPCCQRTFQNVQRHMASQHPDFDPAS